MCDQAGGGTDGARRSASAVRSAEGASRQPVEGASGRAASVTAVGTHKAASVSAAGRLHRCPGRGTYPGVTRGIVRRSKSPAAGWPDTAAAPRWRRLTEVHTHQPG